MELFNGKSIRNAINISIAIFVLINANINISADNANEEELEELTSMSLEELMEIEVYTATKHKQSLAGIPAVMTVLTDRQIEQLGVNSLAELMTFVPGYTKIDTYWKNDIITSRGVKMSLYNDKIMMLINGIPANDAVGMEHFLKAVPIDAIKTVEIVRGPGSVLYGSNAFSGVINVITKDADDTNIAKIKSGSFGYREFGGFFGKQFGDIGVTIAANFSDNDGYNKTAIDERGNEGEINYEDDVHSIYAGLDYKNFSADIGIYRSKYGKFGPVPVFFNPESRHSRCGMSYADKYYLNIAYNKNISDKTRFSFTTRTDYTMKLGGLGAFVREIYVDSLGILDETTPPDYFRNSGHNISADFQFDYDWSEHAYIVAGASGQLRRSDHISDFVDDIGGDLLLSGNSARVPLNEFDFDLFLQANGKITDDLSYVLGGRASYIDAYGGGHFSPKAGLIYSFSSSQNIKLLYGDAFRSPAPHEQYYYVPGLIFGAETAGIRLKPERISTSELVWESRIGGICNLNVNGFYTVVKDIINRRPATNQEIELLGSDALVYDNLPGNEIYGLEAECLFRPGNNFEMFANFTFKKGSNEDTGQDIYYMSNTSGNAGINFTPGNFRISPNINYVGSRKGCLVSGEENNIDPIILVNLSTRYSFSGGLSIAGTIQNLLEYEYFYPEQIRNKIGYIPGGPGRTYYLQISMEM